MNRYTKISSDIDTMSRFIAILSKGHTICGLCNADREKCNAEINVNCVRQYLESEPDSDFSCRYVK